MNFANIMELIAADGLRADRRLLAAKLKQWGTGRITSAGMLTPSNEEWDACREAITHSISRDGLSCEQFQESMRANGFQMSERLLWSTLRGWVVGYSLEDDTYAHHDAIVRWEATRSGLGLTKMPAVVPSNPRQDRDDSAGISFTAMFRVELPPDCPFSIRPMNNERSLFLIREKDKYGEFPNIYAKIVSPTNYDANQVGIRAALLIVLCDTGCGTNVELRKLHSRFDARKAWNLGSFLEATLNPQSSLPYLVITSHCHYDHILGIKNLDLKRCTVLSSAHDKSFITPRSHLAEHSICKDLGISPPKYNVGIWAEDFRKVVLTPPGGSEPISTGITILHTPGHTPDSLSWYDSTLLPPHIFVGDSLYERQSQDTKDAAWGREPPMPTIFNVDSNLADWQWSMHKVLQFVRERNNELRLIASEADTDDWIFVASASESKGTAPRVMLGAAHVTVSVDAEVCLLAMMGFMQRILENNVPHCRVQDEKSYEVWLWDDLLDLDHTKTSQHGHNQPNFGRFSVRAPLFVIEKERARMDKSSNQSSNAGKVL